MPVHRLLIVEDERVTAEDLQDILIELGYSVMAIVSTGNDAITEVEREAPDLVLMDVRIQGHLDGTETAQILRERFDIPVVFLTAHSDEETLSRAKATEPLGYIVKPFQESELYATVEMALHKSHAERERRVAHDRLATVADSIGEGVVCSSVDGIITFMNPSSEVWTGWTRAEASGKSLGEVVRLMTRDGTGVVVLPAHGDPGAGLVGELEGGTVLVAKNGVERPVGGKIALIRDYAGRVNGVVFVFGEPQYQALSREHLALVGRASAPCEDTQDCPSPPDIVAKSESMRQLLRFAKRVAESEASTILIEGESGVGKDVLARFIHESSQRRTNVFLAVNCAAIPENLLESELFGYEKGAFTDARNQKRGILELASGGTVFLDEIGELPLILQAKLLRVLEEHHFRRLGGAKEVEVDLRVITATNCDLRKAIEQGRFRLDLYYRLNVIQTTIPPLRNRKDDIIPLAQYFVALYNRKFRREVKGLAGDAVSVLHTHTWPGNIRELRNTIERAMLMQDGAWIRASDLGIKDEVPVDFTTDKESSGDASLAEVERVMLIRALQKASWNQTNASQRLKITRDTLRYRMKKFKIKAPLGV